MFQGDKLPLLVDKFSFSKHEIPGEIPASLGPFFKLSGSQIERHSVVRYLYFSQASYTNGDYCRLSHNAKMLVVAMRCWMLIHGADALSRTLKWELQSVSGASPVDFCWML